MKKYIDLHTHTKNSDGAHTPEQLCAMALKAGIGALAITDHGYTEDVTNLRMEFPRLHLIQGIELGTVYFDSTGRDVCPHVVGLGFDPRHPKMQAVLKQNNPDRAPYINAILDKLRLCGIDLGTYEDLRKRFPDTRQIGRRDIAVCMKEEGYVSSVQEAYDIYIGAFGERRAFVPNPARYATLEQTVDAIVSAGGIAVLAHLDYYHMSDDDNIRLVRIFKELAGDRGAMEVYYASYTPERWAGLRAMADEVGLMYSAASDFHGQLDGDTLEHGFQIFDCRELMEALGINCGV